ncbi:hypothetical protein MY04_1115 [Flammeovirga sp. MY04]|uniref:hypothetical protein n=1 Tax=Flammeovirga sp. MY04 TaxID=1191459 RepID=UPI000824E5B8|nr:hypothetical protein [Flammeovirga sp. MY04]ANQ48492.2 hypothetical protein MY04_1115 [Flammeovirga sp. MY04]
MKNLSKSSLHTILYDPEHHLLMNSWDIVNEQNFSIEEYKNEVRLWVDVCLKYKPKYCITDTRNFHYVVSKEIQKWSSDLALKEINYVINKYAIILSEKFLSQISLENTIERSIYNVSIDHKYFSDIEVAKKWLLPSY